MSDIEESPLAAALTRVREAINEFAQVAENEKGDGNNLLVTASFISYEAVTYLEDGEVGMIVDYTSPHLTAGVSASYGVARLGLERLKDDFSGPAYYVEDDDDDD